MNRRDFLCCIGCAAAATFVACTRPHVSGKKGRGMSTHAAALKPEDFSYCGIDCKSCDVLKATVHGDQEARMRAAKVFTKTAREHWGMETLDPIILDCRGCRAGGAQHKGYGRCPIRPCAQKRSLSSCALCREWRECGRLSGVFADEPRAKSNLERIAGSSNHGFDHER